MFRAWKILQEVDAACAGNYHSSPGERCNKMLQKVSDASFSVLYFLKNYFLVILYFFISYLCLNALT